MAKIDRLMQRVRGIQKSLQPMFYMAIVKQAKDGWMVHCALWHGQKGSYRGVSRFCADQDEVDRLIEDMRNQYPGKAEPVVIVDDMNTPEGWCDG